MKDTLSLSLATGTTGTAGAAARDAPLVSVIVLSRERPALLRHCLDSVFAQRYRSLEVIVLANGCAETAELVRSEYPRARLIELPENIGCAPGRNRAAAEAQGGYLLFLDDDGQIRATDTIARLVEWIRGQPTVGVVSMALRNADTNRPIGWALSVGEVPYACSHDCFAGGAALIRTEAFRRVGGYLDAFPGPAEEFGLSVLLYGAGYSVVRVPDIVFHHHVNKSRVDWWPAIALGYWHLQYVIWRLYPSPWHLFASAKALATQMYVNVRLGRGRRTLGDFVGALRWVLRGRRDRSPIETSGLSRLYAAKYHGPIDPTLLARASRGVLRRLPFLRLMRKLGRVPKLPVADPGRIAEPEKPEVPLPVAGTGPARVRNTA